MTTTGVRARPRLTPSQLCFGGSEADRAVSVRLIDDEIRARPCSEAFNLVMRGSRAVKTAQTLVGKDAALGR
jgi:hypothetical protein